MQELLDPYIPLHYKTQKNTVSMARLVAYPYMYHAQFTSSTSSDSVVGACSHTHVSYIELIIWPLVYISGLEMPQCIVRHAKCKFSESNSIDICNGINTTHRAFIISV